MESLFNGEQNKHQYNFYYTDENHAFQNYQIEAMFR